MKNDTPCNLCGGRQNHFLFSAPHTHGRHLVDASESFRYFRCEQCSNIFLGGVETDSRFYERYYSSDYYDANNTGARKSVSAVFNWLGFRARRAYVARGPAAGPAKRILDIGCGEGSFLLSLGPDVEKYGVETHPDGVRQCRDKGLKIFDKDVRDVDFGDMTFDVITLWNVIEHIPQPGPLLAKLKRIKTGSGLLVLTVPNTDSLGFRWGREGWFHLDAPRHLFLPNRACMEHLLRQNGFQLVEVVGAAWECPLDLYWSLRKSPRRWLVWPLYPLFKLSSRELLVFIAR